MENYIGRLLDNRYEILEAIGTGGMAVVYKARCHRLNRLVAIKILKDDLSHDVEFRRRFHAESQAVAMLSHPNIVNVYDVSHSDNVDYIVMELIDGISLKQYMEQKRVLSWREVLHFSSQIAKALEHAHSRGIIHRDIKPHNIMILKDGSVKVADFGIARVSSSQSTLTREALGSVHYISPEQAKGGKIDYRSDLYSLGVVMYEMLTGRPPYDGETPVSVAIQHINAKAVNPRILNPQIPIGLEQITMRAMTADLDIRYENATLMLHDLDEFRKNPNINLSDNAATIVDSVPEKKCSAGSSDAERAVSVKKDPTRHTNTKKKRSNSAALIAGILCIGLAIGGIGYFLHSFFLADLFSDSEDIRVPNFVGKHAESIDFTAYPDFQIYIEEWLPNETVEEGYVINQNPKGDRMAKPGASIALTVSSGPSTDSMRDLVNQTVQNAETILDNLDMDIRIKHSYENHDVIGENCIIRTEPAYGEELKPGQTVTLVVSTGPLVKLYPVPELLGMDEQRAIEKLVEQFLKYNITYITSEEPKGTVIYQSIKQGEQVKAGTTVNLQVSEGPADPDEQEPDSEEDPPAEDDPLNSLFPKQRLIDLYLPDLDTDMTVTVLVDGVEEDTFIVDPITVVGSKVQIAITQKGVHEIEVLIDGASWNIFYYDFDIGAVAN